MARRLSILSVVRSALDRAHGGITLGVRGLVRDAARGVLLLEPTDVHNWRPPGGGVERSESAERALEREMIQEAGVHIIGAPELLCVHGDSRHLPGDLVLVYRIEHWSQAMGTSHVEDPSWLLSRLREPVDVTAATRRRIFEATSGAIYTGAIPDLTWSPESAISSH